MQNKFAEIRKTLEQALIVTPTSLEGLRCLYELARRSAVKFDSEKQILELGTFHGATAMIMAQAVKDSSNSMSVVTVDNMLLADDGGSNILNLGFGDTVKVIEGDDIEYLLNCPPSSIAMLFVDSCHRYRHVMKTLDICLPRIASWGVICGHDYSVYQVQVMCAVDDWREANRTSLAGWKVVDSVWWTVKRGLLDG